MQDRLKQLRSFYGLSQAQFAEKIHMAPGFISNVETGRAHVSERTIDAICNAFPINRDWLMYGKGEMFLDGAAQNQVDKSTVGIRVKEIRKREGLTQREFAGRIGYSTIQIHSAEKGKVTPSNQFLEKIAVEFGISSEWLFTGEGDMHAALRLNDRLAVWLNEHPDVIMELMIRAGME